MTPAAMKKKRLALGFSQKELAAQISETVLKGITGPITQMQISHMEKGIRKIQPYVVTFFKNNA